MTRVVVAMSGGVDSSVAAALLVEQGFDVVGITMHLSDYDDVDVQRDGTCCAPDDVRDAARVCAHLGIPHYVANYKAAFKAAVVDRFIADYQQGRTPSPCVHCNDTLKLKLLLERALGLGAEKLATGHYARVVHSDGYELHRGRSLEKDQSYFLFGATQAALSRLLLPVGGLTKDEVREAARRFDLPTAQKAESMDLCFVPDGDYAGFVERHVTPVPGDVVDEDGTVLARHDGIHRFTVGQRRGLGLPGGTPPRFVVGIRGADGQIRVGPESAIFASGLVADGCNWIGAPPAEGATVLARVRHRSPPVPALTLASGSEMTLRFDDPVRAVAPGQAVVVYDAGQPDRVLGGGWIQRALAQ